jgi:hypothetical protein
MKTQTLSYLIFPKKILLLKYLRKPFIRQFPIIILMLSLWPNFAVGQIPRGDLNGSWVAFVDGSMTDFENQPIITFRNFETGKQRDSLKNLNTYYKEMWIINKDSLSILSSYYAFGMTVSTKHENDKLLHRKFFGRHRLIHKRNENGKYERIAKYRVRDLKKEKWDMTYRFGKKDGKFGFEKLKKGDKVYHKKTLILERIK